MCSRGGGVVATVSVMAAGSRWVCSGGGGGGIWGGGGDIGQGRLAVAKTKFFLCGW